MLEDKNYQLEPIKKILQDNIKFLINGQFRNIECSTWNNSSQNVPCGTFLKNQDDSEQILATYITQYLDKLKSYVDLLTTENKQMNLIAKSTIDEIYQRHVFDSLQLVLYLNHEDKTIIDLGSGAGFPGIVLAMLNIWNVTLVESRQKKCEFLKKATEKLNNVKINKSRIEDLPYVKADVIVARALAPLDKLLDLSYKFNHLKIKYIFLKGEKAYSELEIAKKKYKFNYNLYPSLTNNKAFIVTITNLKKRLSNDP